MSDASRYTFRQKVIADLRACHLSIEDTVGAFRLVKHVLFTFVMRHDFACVFMYRINHALARFRRCAALMEVWRFYMFNNDIKYQATIGPGLRIHHTSDIVIGKAAHIGARCHIYNGVTIGAKRPGERMMPRIGNDVLVGTGAKVLGDITVGDWAVIGALTFCDKNVPSQTVAVGNPMRFLERVNKSA